MNNLYLNQGRVSLLPAGAALLAGNVSAKHEVARVVNTSHTVTWMSGERLRTRAQVRYTARPQAPLVACIVHRAVAR